MAKPAYSANTHRAWKADGALFQAFCEQAETQFFPATPQTVRAFVIECQRKARKPATIRRYVATITRAHAAAGLVSPCESEPMRLALKEMGQTVSARQRQAYALGWAEIADFVQSAGEGCALSANGRFFAWRMPRWLGVARSSRSTSRT